MTQSKPNKVTIVQGFEEVKHLMFYCTGCKRSHSVTVGGLQNSKGATWAWNGSLTSPTFSPSILVRWTQGRDYTAKVCHSFIRNGIWEYLGDCTHELAGQHVPMEDVAGDD